MFLWVGYGPKTEVSDHFFLFIEERSSLNLESRVVDVDESGKSPDKFDEPINKISHVSIRVQVCSL